MPCSQHLFYALTSLLLQTCNSKMCPHCNLLVHLSYVFGKCQLSHHNRIIITVDQHNNKMLEGASPLFSGF
jgi:hypothetical protein